MCTNTLTCLLLVPIVYCSCRESPVAADIKLDGAIEILVTSSDAGGSVTHTSCPTNMRHVEGKFCPSVEQKCLRWLDKDQSSTANSGIGPMRCAEFAPTECKSTNRKHMSYCIDTYEWPNVEGEFPLVTIDWYSAKRKCEEVGKRLCTADEWTFACEGEEMRPYPYGDGYHRDEEACDQQHDSMDPSKPRSEWKNYYYAHRSGSAKTCSSPFGVYDMTANVDEWVFNERGNYDKPPYVSGLRGGYWSYKVRTRCRPMTDVHGPGHSFYQQGFRCCRSM